MKKQLLSLPLLIASLCCSYSVSLTAAPVESDISAQSNAPARADLLDLNTATVAQLMELPGIGESKAQAIVNYRDEVGKFLEVDQLTEVKGIGEKMLARIADSVEVR